jgi:hypothetical protein
MVSVPSTDNTPRNAPSSAAMQALLLTFIAHQPDTLFVHATFPLIFFR